MMGDEEGKERERERERETFIDKEYRLSRRCWEERFAFAFSAEALWGEGACQVAENEQQQGPTEDRRYP